MAFMLHSIDHGQVPGIEYLPVSLETALEVGIALKWDGGELALCTGTDKPDYICLCQTKEASTVDPVTAPVLRVSEDMIFETTFAVAGTARKMGEKVTIHTDGKSVTGTTTSGVAEIVYKEGSGAAGEKCRVRFC